MTMRKVISMNKSWTFTGPDGLPHLVDVPHTWNNLDGQDGGNDYWRGICAYAHILAVIFRQPCSAPPQIVGECGKPLAFVDRNTAVIGCGNTRYDKAFVNINPAANWVHDFEHNTSPQNDI